MDSRGNERLREMLAAEYALGTMRGAARRRFERWTRSDPELRALALQWSERLAPLIDSVPSKVPPKRVWEAIEARLPGFTARHDVATVGWWDRLMLWRGLSAAFAAMAVVAIGIASRPLPIVEPRIVEKRVVQSKIVRVQTMPDAIAMLTDPKTGAPIAVVMATDDGKGVAVRVAANIEVPDGKVLQLWIAPRDAKGMISAGLLPAGARSDAASMQNVNATDVGRAKAFGLSLEPAGGSPQPTHVLGLGALMRVSG
ncbi:MAG: anti-sigma factor [Burkholderiaceae bacterium]